MTSYVSTYNVRTKPCAVCPRGVGRSKQSVAGLRDVVNSAVERMFDLPMHDRSRMKRQGGRCPSITPLSNTVGTFHTGFYAAFDCYPRESLRLAAAPEM